MSRWREMLMDYGQVFNGASKASSEFFSVDGDLDEKNSDDRHLRRTLETTFRPLFQRYVYGGEKMACHDMRRILRDPEFRDLLPREKVSELADLTDFNKGRAISYTEFVRVVMGRPNDDEDAFSSFDSDTSLHNGSGGMYTATGILPVICRNTVNQEIVNDRLKGYKCFPPAFFMIAITVGQIACYIYTATKESQVYPLEGISASNDIWYTPTRRREAWRFITYCFLSDGFVDLFFNVLFQIVLGIPLEIIFSFWRLMLVYICGVIVGSLGQSITDRYAGLEGAAGGAMAVTFAHVICMYENWSNLNMPDKNSTGRRVACSVTLRMVIILVLAACQLILAIYRRFWADNTVDIGIGAHVGGILAGLMLGRAFFKDPNRYPWQDGAGFLNLFMFLFFCGFAVVFNIAYYDYPPEEY